MEGLIFFLKQFVIFLGSVQVCFIYYFTLKTRWFGKIRTWYIGALIIYSGSLLLKKIFGTALFPYMLMIAILNIGVVLLLYKATLRQSLFWAAMQYIIGIPVEGTTVFLTLLIQKVTYADLYESFDILLVSKLIVNIVFMIGIVLFIIGWRFHKRKRIGKNNSFLYMAIPLYQMVLLGGYLPCCNISTAPNILIGCLIAIFSILIDFSVILAIDHLNERMEKEEELFDLEKKRKQELQYLEENIERLEDLRLVRHELGNQLQTLTALMEANENRDAVKLMIKDVMGRLEEVT